MLFWFICCFSLVTRILLILSFVDNHEEQSLSFHLVHSWSFYELQFLSYKFFYTSCRDLLPCVIQTQHNVLSIMPSVRSNSQASLSCSCSHVCIMDKWHECMDPPTSIIELWKTHFSQNSALSKLFVLTFKSQQWYMQSRSLSYRSTQQR